MCDTTRRCDRPSCPCNEPDTDLKDALERMQERFPAWACELTPERRDSSEWHAAASDGNGCSTDGYGPTPHAAVGAAIAAWDAAVKADALFQVLKAEAVASRASKISIRGNHAQLAEYRRARAATDKAGALR